MRMTEEELVALANQLRKDTKLFLSLVGLEAVVVGLLDVGVEI